MIRPSRTGASPPLLRLLAVLASIVLAGPAIYLLVRNFTADADPVNLLISDRTLGPLRRTLILAVLVSISTAALGTGLAWLTTRTDLPGRRIWRVLLVLPLVYPTFLGAAALVRTLNPGGLVNDALANIGIDRTPTLQGLWGAWLVLTLLTYPYVFLPVAARFSQLPGSIEQSARLLGDSSWRVFQRIVLPQAFGSIAAGTLLVFLYTISDFGAVAIVRYDTLTRSIETNQLNRPVALALSLILLLLAAVVVLAERYAQRRRQSTTTSVRADRAVTMRLGRLRPLALMATGLATLLGLVAPLAAVLEWSIRGLAGGREVRLDTGQVAALTWNTVWVSTVAAVLTVLLVLPIAMLYGRYRSRAGAIGNAVAISTFALPGILVALAGTFFINQSDWTFATFHNTLGILLFAYMIRFAALAMGTTLLAVKAVPDRLRDAAETLGVSGVQRFVSIDAPLMMPGLLAAGGLVLLSTMKELPISLLLSPFEFETLATRIFGTFSEAFVTEAGLMALTLVLFSFLATWFLVIRPSESSSES